MNASVTQGTMQPTTEHARKEYHWANYVNHLRAGIVLVFSLMLQSVITTLVTAMTIFILRTTTSAPRDYKLMLLVGTSQMLQTCVCRTHFAAQKMNANAMTRITRTAQGIASKELFRDMHVIKTYWMTNNAFMEHYAIPVVSASVSVTNTGIKRIRVKNYHILERNVNIFKIAWTTQCALTIYVLA